MPPYATSPSPHRKTFSFYPNLYPLETSYNSLSYPKEELTTFSYLTSMINLLSFCVFELKSSIIIRYAITFNTTLVKFWANFRLGNFSHNQHVFCTCQGLDRVSLKQQFKKAWNYWKSQIVGETLETVWKINKKYAASNFIFSQFFTKWPFQKNKSIVF